MSDEVEQPPSEMDAATDRLDRFTAKVAELAQEMGIEIYYDDDVEHIVILDVASEEYWACDGLDEAGFYWQDGRRTRRGFTE